MGSTTPKTLVVIDGKNESYVHATGCACVTRKRQSKAATGIFEVPHGTMQQVLEAIWEDCREEFTDAEWANLPGREEVKFSRCAMVRQPSRAPSAAPAGGSAHPEWDAERLANCSEETYAVAVQVRERRERGMAWWQIANELQLKGHGPSATKGKTGAATARRFWTAAWGRTYQSTEAARESADRQREKDVTTPARPYFATDAPDNEIIRQVRNTEIVWQARLGDGSGAVVSRQCARVAPDGIRIVMGRKGRVLEFFEWLDDPERRLRTFGPRRSVYLERIEKVG